MFKKFIKSSILSLVSLITLTSCTMLDNIIGTILANVAVNMPILVMGIDLMPEGLEVAPEQMKWEKLPTKQDEAEEFNYLKNVLIIPNLVKAEIFGKTIQVQVSAEFSGAENMVDNFKKISIGLNDLPEGFDFDLSSLPFPIDLGVDIYIPVGESDILEDVNGFDDLESFMETTKQSELIDATNQEATPFSVKVSVKSGRTVKNKTFYFHLTKPEFGTLILDEVFKLGLLVNTFEYQFDGDPIIEFKQDEAKDAENPLLLTYLTDSLIIPKKVTIKDVGDISVDVEISNNSTSFFRSEVSKPITDFTSDSDAIDLIEGDVEGYTFTPVGVDYNEIIAEKEIATVDAFADYIQDVFENHEQSDLEDLYQASQSEPFTFDLTLTVTAPGGDTRSETYYFGMKKAMLDDQILDFVIDDENIVQKIHYSDVNAPFKVKSDNLDLQMLTETIAFPETVKINGFDNREINFRVDFERGDEDKDKFYPGRQILDAEDIGFDNADITVQTFTPIGEYEPKVGDYNLQGFADEISEMAEKEMEDLYEIVSSEYPDPITVTLTASLEKDGEITEKTRQITLNLVPADVDKEIIDYLIEDDHLINIVNYKDVEKIQEESDPTPYIKSVANEENIEVEHLADTIIIPEQIILEKFGGRVLKVDSEVTPVGEPTVIFGSTQNVNMDGFGITAKTITSTGGYVQSNPTNEDLNVFANELDTKDIYKYSQADPSEVKIAITVSLDNGTDEPEERTRDIFVKFIPAMIDNTEIGDAIFATTSPYSVVNVLSADEYADNPNESALHPIEEASEDNEIILFFDTIVIPQNITFQDFDGKTVDFKYTVKDKNGVDVSDYFLPSEKEHLIDGTIQSVQTLTPKAGFDADGAGLTTFETLLAVITNLHYTDPTSQALFAANQAAEPLEFVLTLSIEIDGEFAGERDYTFIVRPAEASDFFG